jgi:hypothetical protein
MINNKETRLLNQPEPRIGQNGLNKVEGLLTSPIKLKAINSKEPYFWAFFQLEGIPSEIPVIFKVDSGEPTPPPIPPRRKILLEGKWADSPTSSRPSFTCWAFEVISNPPPLTLKDLKDQINSLLSTSLEKQSEWKQRTDYLFRKKKDLEDLEKLTNLGSEYLSAYLLLRKAFYSNYQGNLLPLNQWNPEEYLAKLASEIEEIAQNIRAYQSKEKDLF